MGLWRLVQTQKGNFKFCVIIAVSLIIVLVIVTTKGLLAMPTSRIIEMHPEIPLLVSILDLAIPNCQMGGKTLWCVVEINGLLLMMVWMKIRRRRNK
jgi:hypothetical protein